MDEMIIRGTTPTIQYTFNVVDTSDIASAYMTLKQNDIIVIEKSLEDAEIEEDSVSWMLTQEETLSLAARGVVGVMVNWKLADGTRGACKEHRIGVVENHKNEVI